MKLQARQIESFLQKPLPSVRAVLIYGPDRGLMKTRSQQLTTVLKIDRDDPFSSVLIDGTVLAEDPERLEREASTISLMGGVRFVGIRDADDAVTPALKIYLDRVASADSFVICEAGELSPRSALRLLCERAENALALPCYVEEEKDLQKIVVPALAKAGLTIDRDSVALFCAIVAGDRQQVDNEIEKLIVFAHPITHITEREVAQSLGRDGAPDIDALVDAYGLGQGVVAADLATALLAEGNNVIGLVRVLLNHVRRLHRVKSEMAAGAALDTVMDGLNPKVFYKRVPAFRQQIHRVRFDELNRMMAALMAIEFKAKQTGEPDLLLFKQHLLLRS